MRSRRLLWFVLVLTLFSTPSWADKTTAYDNIALGIPDCASLPGQNASILRDQYAVCYSNDTHIPKWVAWHLTSEDLGNADRYNCFSADPGLPSGWYRVVTGDYTGSGYDRGHMCPSADRTDTPEDNRATFYMTNILPQAPGNNQGPWVQLENYERELVAGGNELFVISGGSGSKGEWQSRNTQVKITIPSHTWKAILILPEGLQDLDRVDANTQVLAVRMPNEDIRSRDWREFITSVDALEGLELDLFSSLPKEIQAVIEAKAYKP
jgi:endonuclease G